MADVAEEYRSSLSELSFNSKPHINMLTMIAEENIKHAPSIVQTIVEHINSVTPDMKLPSLYLVDSVVKNIGKIYVQLFSKHLIALFTSVFEKVDENVRSLLYKLRSTWTGIFPNALLLRLDKSVVLLDPAWPILAQPAHKNIHVNPKFLDKPATQLPKKEEVATTPQCALLQEANEIKKKQLEVLKVLQAKKQQLMELKRKATLATASSEYLGSDVQKALNVRDPRLSKKVPDTDNTALHSVVVIPKESQATVKKDDVSLTSKDLKHSSSPESKKIKIDHVDSYIKKDLRSKLNEFKNGSKAVEPKHHSNKMYSVNNQNKNRKRTISPDSRIVPPSKISKDKDESDKIPVKRMNVNTDISNQPVKNVDSFNHFASNKDVIVPEGLQDQYKEMNMKQKEDPVYENSHRLEPPPAPLLFGNEDKDYRTLLPQKHNSEERVRNDASCPKRMPPPVVKSFKLDNKERKIYFVNDRSFAVMDNNVPKELTFEGPPKLIFVEGLTKPFELGFGGHEMKFEIDGKWNSMKFGTPAQEIFINGYPHEAQFGGPPITALLENGKVHRIHISGPPPQVILSQAPAYELYDRFCQNHQEFLRGYDNLSHEITSDMPVASRDVDMRVNNNKFPSTVFNFPVEKVNDVDWQRMPLGGSQPTVCNAPKNSFETFKDANPNFVPHRNYPDRPRDWSRAVPLTEQNKQNLAIPPPMPPNELLKRFPLLPLPTAFQKEYSDGNRNLPPFTSECLISVPACNSMAFSGPNYNNPSEFASNPQFSKVQLSNTPRLTPPPLPPFLGPIPNSTCMTAPFVNTVVTNPMPVSSLTVSNSAAPIPISSVTNSIPMTGLSNSTKTSGLSNSLPVTSLSNPVEVTSSSTLPPVSNAPPVNMDVFLEKLIAAGIIGKKSGTSTPPPAVASTEPENSTEEMEEIIKEEPIPEIVFEAKCLKEYHGGVINALHSGSQCATCGMRFKEMQSEQYSRHLDWHFRMNRREKDGAKKPFSRRLFYEIKDWVDFKEFEEVDERAPSYFELQASGDQTDEIVPETLCSVPSTECESETCAVCGEQFQLFWVEEEEEWHLRNAVKQEEQVYHPACYEDFKKANESVNTELDTSVEESTVKTDTEMEEEQADGTKETSEMEDREVKPEIEEKPEPDIQDAEPVIQIKEEPMEETQAEIEISCEAAEVKPGTEAVKVEENAEPVKVEENAEPVKVEKSAEPVKIEVNAEAVKVKENAEPVKVKENAEAVKVKENAEAVKVKGNVEPVNVKENIEPVKVKENAEPVKVADVPIQSKVTESSPSENVPIKTEEDAEIIEFRPPTPDPRFQVLPPVLKGTELSALCTIM